jgi:hypothetical protein
MGLPVLIDEPNVRFVNQRRRLQGMVGRFLGHLRRGEAAQFAVDQRQKLLGRLWLALLDRGKNSRDVVHTDL